jgi:hypothetical protein
MNEIIQRRQTLTHAAATLDNGALPPADFLYRLGQVYRLSCTDGDASDEAAALIDEADALLARLQEDAPRRQLQGAQLPDLALAHAWFAAPRGHHAGILATLDRLGATLAALSLVAPGSPLHHQADVAMNELSRRVQSAAAPASGALLDLAVAALEHIALNGIVPGEDRALLALDAIAQRSISAAFHGEPLPTPRVFPVRPLAAEQAEALGKALAAAMQRSQPLQVAPDLLQLADFPTPPAGSRRAFDLMLHGAAPDAPLRESIELMQDVQVTVTDEEIEVELLGEVSGAVLLVPLHRGEPGQPCPSRSGNHAGHLVFAPPPPDADLDGYALVVGDRLAFLRR